MSTTLSIIRYVLFGLFSLATIGVIVGVYWENDKFPKEKQDRGWRLLVWSLSLEVVFSIAGFGVDSFISSRQRDEIIASETAILEILEPRHLSDDAEKRIVDKLSPLGPQPFVYGVTPAMEEGSDLHKQLGVLLIKDCKWELHRLSPGSPTIEGTEAIGVALNTGVTISYDKNNSALKRAAETLAEALGNEGIAAEATPQNANNAANDKAVISVAVGTKPLIVDFLRHKPDWIKP